MKQIYSWLKKLAQLINFTRLFIVNTIFLIIIILIVVAINVDEQQVAIADNSILHLNFQGNIVEQKQPVDFSSELSKQLLSAQQSQVNEYQIDEILQVIRYAQDEPKIKSILLELDGLSSASLNHLTDIGKALNEFKEKGKAVTAISDNYSQTQYLLASFADKIYLNPQGLVFLQGFSVYRLYFKEALDNLLITPHIFKVGTYKSFVEPFTQNQMSKESKLANRHWLNQLWQNYIATVISERKDKSTITAQSLSPSLAQLKSALQNTGGDTAQYAKQAGLVDFLNNRFEIITKFKEQAKSDGTDFNLLGYDDYQSTLPRLYESPSSHDQIALIHGSGEILAGEQNRDAIGGDSFSQLLEKALNNNRVKAVVIRLDTPGGSAFASEKIRQQVLALKKAGKKVVVSMGSVTASGGYWIASAADHIVASPTTLTGSIGIFGMFASAEKALNKFGIYNDGVGTSELSTIDPTRALNPDLAEIMQIGIEHGYQQFLTIVADGRDMSLVEVDNVAQGRVWTGIDAQQRGLVDQLGNLQDAITQAAELAQLTQYEVKEIAPALSTKQQLLNDLFTSAVQFLPQGVQISPVLYQAINSLQSQTAILTKFNDPQGRYAYCPMCIIN
ncbi:MAG: protease-4 [Psychromonas sp.]|jgi:protease-4|uniref:signal peptide peptidase SppA n=1 Tax=Psychromonas sp. TaxID=1884585 RepID=UPI0039E5B136